MKYYNKFISIKNLDEKLIKVFDNIDYKNIAIFDDIINNV